MYPHLEYLTHLLHAPTCSAVAVAFLDGFFRYSTLNSMQKCRIKMPFYGQKSEKGILR